MAVSHSRQQQRPTSISDGSRGPSFNAESSFISTPFNRRQSQSYSTNTTGSASRTYSNGSGGVEVTTHNSDTIRATGPPWLKLQDLRDAVYDYLEPQGRIVDIDVHETKISNVCNVKFQSVHAVDRIMKNGTRCIYTQDACINLRRAWPRHPTSDPTRPIAQLPRHYSSSYSSSHQPYHSQPSLPYRTPFAASSRPRYPHQESYQHSGPMKRPFSTSADYSSHTIPSQQSNLLDRVGPPPLSARLSYPRTGSSSTDRRFTPDRYRPVHPPVEQDTPTSKPVKRLRTDTGNSYFSQSRRTSSSEEGSPPPLSLSHSRAHSSSRSLSPDQHAVETPKYLLPTRKDFDGKALSARLSDMRSAARDAYAHVLHYPSIDPICDYDHSAREPIEADMSKISSGSYHTAGSSFTEVLQGEEDIELERDSDSEDASFRTPEPFEEVEQLPLEEFMDEVAVRLWEWVQGEPDRCVIQLDHDEEDELEAEEHTAAEQHSPGCRVV